MVSRKGRPKLANPKDIDIKVRVDKTTNEKLKQFAECKKISRTEVIRQGINMILDSEQ